MDAGTKQLPGEVEPGNFLIDGIIDWGLDDDGDPAAEVKWHKWGHAHNTVVKLDLIGHDSSLVRTFIRKLEREEQRWHFLQGQQVCLIPVPRLVMLVVRALIIRSA